MKEAYYFSHDANARNDEKILCLIADHGAEGYGVFWFLLEMMFENQNTSLSYKHVKGVANVLNMETANLLEIISCCVDYGLFVKDDDTFWSESLRRRKQEYYDKRKKKVEAGFKSGEVRRQKSIEEKEQSGCNADGIELIDNIEYGQNENTSVRTQDGTEVEQTANSVRTEVEQTANSVRTEVEQTANSVRTELNKSEQRKGKERKEKERKELIHLEHLKISENFSAISDKNLNDSEIDTREGHDAHLPSNGNGMSKQQIEDTIAVLHVLNDEGFLCRHAVYRSDVNRLKHFDPFTDDPSNEDEIMREIRIFRDGYYDELNKPNPEIKPVKSSEVLAAIACYARNREFPDSMINGSDDYPQTGDCFIGIIPVIDSNKQRTYFQIDGTILDDIEKSLSEIDILGDRGLKKVRRFIQDYKYAAGNYNEKGQPEILPLTNTRKDVVNAIKKFITHGNPFKLNPKYKSEINGD